MNFSDELTRLIDFYENLGAQALHADLARVYAADAVFKDPFNEVQGLAEIEKIFAHMFKQVHDPRFKVNTRVLQGAEAFLVWDFTFRMHRSPERTECIRGATHIRFNEEGGVVLHRDYWDAAEELYEKLPVLGALMRWLKRAAKR
ncbi:MAG: nuclear transport factor 2 family protein [Pseudomonadota bacterium]